MGIAFNTTETCLNLHRGNQCDCSSCPLVIALVHLLDKLFICGMCTGNLYERGFKNPTSAGVDGGRTKCPPYNSLAYIGSDKEGDTRPESIALLQQFIQQQHNQTSNKQLLKTKIKIQNSLKCTADLHL